MKKWIQNCEKICATKCAGMGCIIALITRLSVGWVFLESGLGKFRNLPNTIKFFESIGIPMASLQAPFVAGVELVGGALLIVGLATRFASIPLIGTMVVAILTAHLSEINSASDLFGLMPFLFILLLGWIVTHGAGSVSLDAKFCRKK